MLKTISGTFASKFILALLNFATIVLSTQLLGASGRGEISFFVTNMVFILLFTGLIGGPSLVYLTPRYNFFNFLIPTYAWSLVLTCAFCVFFYMTGQLFIEEFSFLFFATLLNSWKSVNMMILLGKEKMSAFNWLALLHSIFLITFFLTFYFLGAKVSTQSFYWGVLLSNGIIWLFSVLLLFRLGESFTLKTDRHLLAQLVSYGGLAQLANIIQFANYRISYYYLMNISEKGGAAELGKYSIAVSIAESVWIIGQSLATVQFSRLSNINDPKERRKISLRLFRFNFILNVLAVFFLLILPSQVYVWIFGGEEFSIVSAYIQWMAIGIFAMGGISTSVAAYFGGMGRYSPAIGSAVLGVLFTVAICHLWIEQWGVKAAALSSTVSYSVIALYFLICFVKAEKLSFGHLFPGIKELKLYVRWVKKAL